MKTIIFSGFSIENQLINEAFTDIELVESDNYSWYKGKLVGKEIFYVDLADINIDFNTLLELLMAEGGSFQAVSIDLGRSLNDQLRTGDIIINDYPQGSFQDTIDFLLEQGEYDDPMRIFVGEILTEGVPDNSGLACLELMSRELVDTLKSKGIYSLLIRPVIADNSENEKEQQKIFTIAQQLFHLVKRSIEKKI